MNVTPSRAQLLEVVYSSKGVGGHLPKFPNRGLAALEAAGLVVQRGGKWHVTDAGIRYLEQHHFTRTPPTEDPHV